MLTPEDRAAVLRRVLGDPVLQSMNELRAATRRFVWWPWSRRRMNTMFDRLEDVMAVQVNRVMGSAGAVAEAMDKRITDMEERRGE